VGNQDRPAALHGVTCSGARSSHRSRRSIGRSTRSERRSRDCYRHTLRRFIGILYDQTPNAIFNTRRNGYVTTGWLSFLKNRDELRRRDLSTR